MKYRITYEKEYQTVSEEIIEAEDLPDAWEKARKTANKIGIYVDTVFPIEEN